MDRKAKVIPSTKQEFLTGKERDKLTKKDKMTQNLGA
jgi:hypothetical protein